MNARGQLFVPTLLALSVTAAAAPAADNELGELRRLAEDVAASIAAGQPAEERLQNLSQAVHRCWAQDQRGVADLGSSLLEQGDEAAHEGQLAEAHKWYLAAWQIERAIPSGRGVRALKPQNSVAAQALQRLGEMYRRMDRYSRAERYLQQALEGLNPQDPNRFFVLNSLGDVYRSQGRLAAAEACFLQAVGIAVARPGNVPDRPLMIAVGKMNLGICYYDLATSAQSNNKRNLWQDSDTQYALAVEALAGQPSGGFPDRVRAMCFNNQGRLYHGWWKHGSEGKPQGLSESADASYRRALDILNRNAEANRSDIIDTLNKLAQLHFDLNDLPTAETHIRAAFELSANAPLVELELGYTSHYVRARIRWAKNQPGPALADLDEAIHLGARQRAHGAGGPFDRGRYYTQLMNAAERMVIWRAELAPRTQGKTRNEHIAAAFRAMELTRALALQDQIALRGKDLFQGIEGAAGLRADLLAAKNRVLAADTALREAAQKGVPPKRAFEQLVQAKAELREVERQIWNASPVVEQQMAAPPMVAAFDQVQAWATRTNSLVLQYFIGETASYVLAMMPSQDPILESLNWDPHTLEAARVRLSDLDRMIKLQESLKTVGELFDLARSEKEREKAQREDDRYQEQFARWREETNELHVWLAALYQQLVPTGVRAKFAEAEPSLERVVILPDGPLVRLPFETLVTDNDAHRRTYLIDADLPIVYSLSGTMLVEQSGNRAAPAIRAGTDVCFVGKSDFSDHAGSWVPTDDGRFGQLDLLAQAADAGPATFPGILAAAGLNVEILNQDRTTGERQVVEAIQRARIVLFSTHGLAGNEESSSFGALVLTRPKQVESFDDDGMFTYEEICECDLRRCELAIHTACATNVGPNQRGEGAWAVSRGFLVAGASRVLATQWESENRASDLFSAGVASRLASQQQAQQTTNSGQLDYARAVHEARLQLRLDKVYGETPVLWATWILIGAN